MNSEEGMGTEGGSRFENWLAGLLPVLVVLALGAIAMGISFAGCGNNVRIQGRDTIGARVINMPHHWSNVATKCAGRGFRVFESDNGGSSSAIAVVQDKTCR